MGSGSAAYQRIAQREEEARAAMNDRIEGALDQIIRDLESIQSDVRRLEHGSTTLTNRIADVERQIIDTRDEVQKRARNQAPSQIASAKIAIKDTVKSPWGRAVAFCIALAALAAGMESVPKLLRGIENAWHYASQEKPSVEK